MGNKLISIYTLKMVLDFLSMSTFVYLLQITFVLNLNIIFQKNADSVNQFKNKNKH